MLELPKSEQYEFEFYQAKKRFVEMHEGQKFSDYYYDYYNAPDTYVNDMFSQEKRFTFRMTGNLSEEPEYKIEIEKGMNLTFADSRKSLTNPVLIKEVSAKNDSYWTVGNGQGINQILEDKYQISSGDAEYLYLNNLIAKVDKECKGLISVSDPVSRDIHTNKSTKTLLGEVADGIKQLIELNSKQNMMDQSEYERLQKMVETLDNVNQSDAKEKSEQIARPRNEWKANSDWKKSRKVKIEEFLSTYLKAELEDMARDYGLSINGERKNKIVYMIARHILEPETMRNQLLQANEEELDVFEMAMEKGCFLPDFNEKMKLEVFCDLNYLAEYFDDYMAVPEEVKTVYEILKRTGYREYHKKMCWMISCLKMFEMIHVVAPIRVVYRMYRRDKSIKLSFDEFIELFQKVPEQYQICCIEGDMVFIDVLKKDDLYLQIESRQRSVEYYIPSYEEIISYSTEDYPACDDSYKKVYQFFLNEMGLKSDVCEYLCIQAFQVFLNDGMLSEFMDIVNEEEIIFPSMEKTQVFASLIMQAANDTRRYSFRGHTPNELSVFRSPGGSKHIPTIVPVSSMAADLLNASKGELEAMGIPVNLDAYAAKTTIASYPDGLTGKAEVKTKKIYPNDPCPCGSGKKYKKCCGRK